MDESTTTNEPTDTGVQETQPAEVDTQAAENQPAEPTESTDSQEAVPVTDDNLAWLQNKGIDPQSPEALGKVAEMYRNAEKAMHASTQEKAQLQTALEQPAENPGTDYQDDPVSALTAQVQALTMKSTVNDFFNANPEAKQYEADMASIVNNDPTMAALVKGGYFPIDKLYQLARGADPNREATLKSEGGREALQKVADKQQAKAVPGNATSSAMSTSGPTRATVNEWYAGLTAEQRANPETQRTLASLL
jgi:hypothetical protein